MIGTLIIKHFLTRFINRTLVAMIFVGVAFIWLVNTTTNLKGVNVIVSSPAKNKQKCLLFCTLITRLLWPNWYIHIKCFINSNVYLSKDF